MHEFCESRLYVCLYVQSLLRSRIPRESSGKNFSPRLNRHNFCSGQLSCPSFFLAQCLLPCVQSLTDTPLQHCNCFLPMSHVMLIKIMFAMPVACPSVALCPNLGAWFQPHMQNDCFSPGKFDSDGQSLPHKPAHQATPLLEIETDTQRKIPLKPQNPHNRPAFP